MSLLDSGQPWFNLASPSSDTECIKKIVAKYIDPVAIHTRPVRVLDVGGTASGFRERADLGERCQIVIANPEESAGADYKYVKDIPPDVPCFHFAMMFGVMYHLPGDMALSVMRDVKQRLCGRGAFLVAERDPNKGGRKYEKFVLTIYNKRATFPTQTETEVMLREAGFGRIDDQRALMKNTVHYMLAGYV